VLLSKNYNNASNLKCDKNLRDATDGDRLETEKRKIELQWLPRLLRTHVSINIRGESFRIFLNVNSKTSNIGSLHKPIKRQNQITPLYEVQNYAIQEVLGLLYLVVFDIKITPKLTVNSEKCMKKDSNPQHSYLFQMSSLHPKFWILAVDSACQ